MDTMDIEVGDRVYYQGMTTVGGEGWVTKITKPLGWREFTVKLDNGLVRICAKYQLKKLPKPTPSVAIGVTSPDRGALSDSEDDSWFDEVDVRLPSTSHSAVKFCMYTDSKYKSAPGCVPAKSSQAKDASGKLRKQSTFNRFAANPCQSKSVGTTVSSKAPSAEAAVEAKACHSKSVPMSVSNKTACAEAVKSAPKQGKSTEVNIKRFVDVSVDDIDQFISDKENKNTASKTKQHVQLVQDYLRTINEKRKIEEIPAAELNVLLGRFFLAVRKLDGGEYEPGTLRNMLSSVQRHLNHQNDVSLIKDHSFSGMREVMRSKNKDLKSQGKGNRPHKAEVISDSELDTLYERKQLGLSSPGSLLNTMWFISCKNFGLRGGKEEHRRMKWGDVTLHVNSQGREYIEYKERQTKTSNK